MLYGRYLTTAEIVDGVRAVRPTDVLAAAEQLLDPDRQTLVTHGPEADLHFG
jgi:predicted Zn-dependent peptidase